jgi:hypothetical protein
MGRATFAAGRGKTATRPTDLTTVEMNVEKNPLDPPKYVAQPAQRAATVQLLGSFIAGDVGARSIDRIDAVAGESLATASRLDVIEGNSATRRLPAA